MFGNTEFHHIEAIFFKGVHKTTLNLPSALYQNDMERAGLHTYLFCEGVVDEIVSVFNSLKAFVGGMGLHGIIPFF